MAPCANPVKAQSSLKVLNGKVVNGKVVKRKASKPMKSGAMKQRLLTDGSVLSLTKAKDYPRSETPDFLLLAQEVLSAMAAGSSTGAAVKTFLSRYEARRGDQSAVFEKAITSFIAEGRDELAAAYGPKCEAADSVPVEKSSPKGGSAGLKACRKLFPQFDSLVPEPMQKLVSKGDFVEIKREKNMEIDWKKIIEEDEVVYKLPEHMRTKKTNQLHVQKTYSMYNSDSVVTKRDKKLDNDWKKIIIDAFKKLDTPNGLTSDLLMEYLRLALNIDVAKKSKYINCALDACVTSGAVLKAKDGDEDVYALLPTTECSSEET